LYFPLIVFRNAATGQPQVGADWVLVMLASVSAKEPPQGRFRDASGYLVGRFQSSNHIAALEQPEFPG